MNMQDHEDRHHQRHHHGHAKGLRNRFLPLLREATTKVPFPWLFFAEVFPKQEAGESAGCHLVNYVFKINNEFVAQLQHLPFERREERPDVQRSVMQPGSGREDFSPAVLLRQNLSYEYRTIAPEQRMISLGRALEIIHSRLLEAELDDWFVRRMGTLMPSVLEVEDEALIEDHYERAFEEHALSFFHSVALVQPFSPQYLEPFYVFRIPRSSEEVCVGALSGELRFK